MNKARTNPVNAFAMHGALIVYTLIALFPVFVILINSFKTRKAIFREPLALPDAESFSMIGYQTVMKQGDFFLYFQNSLIVTVASLFFVLLFGAIAAFALAGPRGICVDDACADLGLAVCRHPDDADLCGPSLDPGRNT